MLNAFVVQNPWALWALCALVIPLIIHLISKGRSTLIKFANISLIDAVKPKNMRQLQLTEFWLLVTRLLLLFVSILLLAQVLLVKPPSSFERVTLVTPQWLNISDDKERNSLINLSADAPIYLLSGDSEILSKSTLINWPHSQRANSQTLTMENIDLNLYYLSQSFGQKVIFDVFVTDYAAQFSETKLLTALDINWHVRNTTVDNSNTDKINTIKPYDGDMDVAIIYDQNRTEDIAYIQQALNAIQSIAAPNLSKHAFLNSALESNTSFQELISNTPDWIFYLSSAKPDNSILEALKAGSNFVVDAKSANVNPMLSSAVQLTPNSAEFSPTTLTFYQQTKALNIGDYLPDNSYVKSNAILWKFTDENAITNPLLVKSTFIFNDDTSSKSSVVYQLFSRFSPSWNDLVTTKYFPLLLQNILFDEWQKTKAKQQNRLTTAQIAQVNVTEKVSIQSNLAAFDRLAPIVNQHENMRSVWLNMLIALLLILWFVERLVSELTMQKKLLSPKVMSNSVDEATR